MQQQGQYYEQILSLDGVSIKCTRVYETHSKELVGFKVLLSFDHSKLEVSRLPKSSKGSAMATLKLGTIVGSKPVGAITWSQSFLKYFPYYATTTAKLTNKGLVVTALSAPSKAPAPASAHQEAALQSAPQALVPAKAQSRAKSKAQAQLAPPAPHAALATSAIGQTQALEPASTATNNKTQAPSIAQGSAQGIKLPLAQVAHANLASLGAPKTESLELGRNELSLSDSEIATHTKYMNMALELALKAWECGEVPVGALIVDSEGKIIGKGYNRTIIDHDPSAHAEIMALREAGNNIHNYRLLGCTMYVTLEPCCMCAMALVHARLSKVVFGAFDAKTGACGSRFDLICDARHNHKIEVIGGIEKDICSSTISNFFAERRKAKSAERAARKAAQQSEQAT